MILFYLILHLFTFIWTSSVDLHCKKYEFECINERCINLDRFCNGIPDCQDQSDEPPNCTRKLSKILIFIIVYELYEIT